MKVLYAAQISNNTLVNGIPKFVFETDACYNLCVGIVNTLAEQNPTWKFLVLLPHESLGVDVRRHEDKFESKNIQFILYDSPVGPGNTRYHFDYLLWQKYAKTGAFSDIDVMINDQNTLTKNWNMIFHEADLNIPIVSTNYFMDSILSKKVPEKIRYYERQMESFINSDMTAHQSQANYREAMGAFRALFNNDIAMEVERKSTIWRTGLRASEVSKYNTDETFENITVYFGNRISDTADRYNNYHIFAQAIGVLEKYHSHEIENVDFVYLNPTRKVTEKQLSDIKEWSLNKAIVMDNTDEWNRDMYMDFINKAHISVNLFTNEVHGGVTHAEAMLSDNIVILPNVNNYKWKYDQIDEEYPFLVEPDLVNNKLVLDPNKLANKLLSAINTVKYDLDEYKHYCELNKELAYKYESYENACVQIKEDLEYLVENK